MGATVARRKGTRSHRPPRLLALAGDERLVALVREGSDSAFEAIYDRHHPAILSFCRHMLGNREDAEDAVQHTFVSAHRALGRDGRTLHLRAWLFAIARNRCLDILRARRETATEIVEPATEGLAAEVERREDLRALLEDLAGLPDDQREALVLAELGALPHTEIAGVIGVPPAKVKALVFQARERLEAGRRARDTPCAEIRQELAVATGAALRRTGLRRHLEVCPGCRAYREQVKHQRRALAVLLPVLPTAALKGSVLHGIAGGGGGGAAAGGAVAGGGAAAGGGGGAAGSVLSVGLAKTGVAKLAAVAALAGGAAATVGVVNHAGPRDAAATRGGAHLLNSTPPVRSTGSRSSGGRVPGRPRAVAARPPLAPRAAAARAAGRARHGRGAARGSDAHGATVAVATRSAPAASVTHGQGATHRSASGAAHAATPVRAGGTVQPGVNARGKALGHTKVKTHGAKKTTTSQTVAAPVKAHPTHPVHPTHPIHPPHPAHPAKPPKPPKPAKEK